MTHTELVAALVAERHRPQPAQPGADTPARQAARRRTLAAAIRSVDSRRPPNR